MNTQPDNQSAENTTDGALGEQLKGVHETGAVTTDNGRHVIHCLTIIGQIEGHVAAPVSQKATRYEHVIPQLVAVQEDPEIEGLLILLNTYPIAASRDIVFSEKESSLLEQAGVVAAFFLITTTFSSNAYV